MTDESDALNSMVAYLEQICSGIGVDTTVSGTTETKCLRLFERIAYHLGKSVPTETTIDAEDYIGLVLALATPIKKILDAVA